jgi:hypothetical protein
MAAPDLPTCLLVRQLKVDVPQPRLDRGIIAVRQVGCEYDDSLEAVECHQELGSHRINGAFRGLVRLREAF